MTPMMRQYLDVKKNYPDSILFFRMGDFYEMFLDDAILASRELEIALTSRSKGEDGEKNPMCGVPYHAADAYIDKLIAKGYKVAICEQLEDPATAKGIVKRDVIRVVTPGTVINSKMLDEKKNNFLCAVYGHKTTFGAAFSDLTTGEVFVTSVSGRQRLIDEIARYSPTEIVVSSEVFKNAKLRDELRYRFNASLEMISAEPTRDSCEHLIYQWFHITDLSELHLSEDYFTVNALGMILMHFEETQKMQIGHIKRVSAYSENEFMDIDIFTRRNLEITETMRSKAKKGSLLWVLDKTKTAMGGRLMRSFVEKPLIDCAQIAKRHYAVSELFEATDKREQAMEVLEGIYDIERLLGKISCKSASPKEMISLKQSLQNLPQVEFLLSGLKAPLFRQMYERIDTLEDIAELIDAAITEEDTPISLKDGGIIKTGYDSQVDEFRNLAENGQSEIAKIEAREKELTGIKTLRTGYNRVFGYYIEVSKSYRDSVPDRYIRKQTLTNGERYITEELKELETKVLGASEFLKAREYELFCGIRDKVAEAAARIQTSASVVAHLDVICSLSEVAVKNGYTMPCVDASDKIEIKGGRHPVVELLSPMPFVPNDTVLDCDKNRCAIITGPNMAGKSTYMRQVAIIVLMAQIGCFVPAQSADIPICDAIFTRVGASDDLATGQSTFMVEMSEVANIIKNATSRSLLILDEIGRGTSTYDGMAIARSVLEYVSNKKKIGAKTLFATHYHELTALEGQLDGVKNYNVAVKKRGDDITFLRRIVRGGADDSYGVEVAKLSGVPDAVIERAKDILHTLESGNGVSAAPAVTGDEAEMQMTFELHGAKKLLEELKLLDVNTLTPIECMTMLNDIVKKARDIK